MLPLMLTLLMLFSFESFSSAGLLSIQFHLKKDFSIRFLSFVKKRFYSFQIISDGLLKKFLKLTETMSKQTLGDKGAFPFAILIFLKFGSIGCYHKRSMKNY